MQALRCGVDRSRQAGRAGPDDGDVAVADVVADGPADCGDELRAVRPDRRVPVVTNEDRKPRLVQAMLAEQVASRPAVGGDEAERHVEAGQQFPQLVPCAVIEADDAEQLEGSLGIPGPVGQADADHTVEILLEHPRLGDVRMGLAEDHRLDDRAPRRVVALH